MGMREDGMALEEVENGSSIRVVQGVGINLQLNAKIAHCPDAVYQVLTDPDAASVFRSIQACTNRKVLEEDKRKGTRKLAVSHKAISRFLFIKVTFETHLHVWEDDKARSIRFQNAREGFMKKFEGTWNVRPFTQHSLDLATAPPPAALNTASVTAPAWLNPTAMMTAAQRLFPAGPSHISLVTLDQHIHANQQPPAPIRSLIKRLCSKQLKDMMEDLRTELDRRAQGKTGTKGRHPDKKSSAYGRKSAAASTTPSPTASITTSQPQDLWQHVTPLISVTIQL